MQLGLPGAGHRGGALPRRLPPAPLPQCNIELTEINNGAALVLPPPHIISCKFWQNASLILPTLNNRDGSLIIKLSRLEMVAKAITCKS